MYYVPACTCRSLLLSITWSSIWSYPYALLIVFPALARCCYGLKSESLLIIFRWAKTSRFLDKSLSYYAWFHCPWKSPVMRDLLHRPICGRDLVGRNPGGLYPMIIPVWLAAVSLSVSHCY